MTPTTSPNDLLAVMAAADVPAPLMKKAAGHVSVVLRMTTALVTVLVLAALAFSVQPTGVDRPSHSILNMIIKMSQPTFVEQLKQSIS